MCGKLLLNLIDCIIKIPDKSEGRELLMRILDAFASKFASLNILFKTCLKQHLKKSNALQSSQIYPTNSNSNNSTVEIQDSFDYDRAKPINATSSVLDPQHDGIKDARFLFKNFTVGLKSLFIGLRHCNPAPPPETNTQLDPQFVRGFTQQDIHVLIRLFREGLVCFEYYNVDQYGPNGSLPFENINYEELKKTSVGCNDLSLVIGTQATTEKETLEIFAAVFTLLDPAIFQEIFVSQMGFFFDRMLINTSLVHIAQYFLVNEASSQGFVSILLQFLVDRLEQLGGEDMHYSAVQLHLFRLSFMAINLFPNFIEPVLQPYLSSLVVSCFKLSAKAKEPANYFLLLRAMFKNIGGGRFELLYKEIGHLIQMILEGLNSLLTLTHKPEMRNLLVELALALPVRLSTLCPYLPLLMKPLVIALQAENELVIQGLRTIELCNDNLTPEFLDPVMEPVMHELITSLYKLLRPLPHNQQYSQVAMRILGKLGGRNRRILNTPPVLDYKELIEDGLSLEIIFDPNTVSHSLPLDKCLKLACQTLEDQEVDLFYKKHAHEFLKTNLIMMLELDQGPDNLTQTIHYRVQQFLQYKSSNNNSNTKSKLTNAEMMDIDEVSSGLASEEMHQNDAILKPKRLSNRGYTRYFSKRLAQEEAFRTILVAILKASAIPALAEDAWPFFRGICRHFMLLHINEVIEVKKNGSKSLLDVMDEKLSAQNLSTIILVDAIVKMISSEDPKFRQKAEESLQLCFNIAVNVMGGKEHVWRLPIFRVFASQFCSYCYKQDWYHKRGGCIGISIISSQLDMGIQWMREHEIEFIRALLFVLKDASPEMANANTTEATQTLAHVLKVCNRPDDDESEESQQKFQNLIALLLSELSNSNSAVRETVQSSFQLLADLTGNEVTELLAPVRERLVAPIFAKPLRALPFAMQIGHIDAITYCLTLRPPFLEFNDELIRLLHEALALADAEDEALVSKSSQQKNATSLMNLRIVCVQLLSAAMACSDFSNQRQTRMGTRIIQVFFKSLYSSTPEVVEAAHRGLKQVLSQQSKLPRELLQQGLRPILSNLSNHQKLTVSGLEGLARLLELLTVYFKVEIGKKLLDHLTQLADPSALQEAAGTALCNNHSVKIIVAILNVFHLLPAAAHIFLDSLVSAVLKMESHLRCSVSSPFRPNLIKYLNRYPAEAVAYFYDRLDRPQYSHLFIDILGVENAVQLRDEVSKSTSQLLEKTLKVPGDSSLHYQGVLIVREMVRYDTNWLSGQPDVLAALIELWRSPTRKIVIQIYAALLRSHLSEARPLVRQGLDIISPVLPSRVSQTANERIPTWIRLTRKVIVEDTHSISQMVNVYQLLVRHPELFYDYREHFLPQIVNALPKLGLFQNVTPENKLLTVELAELIYNWEQKRLQHQARKDEGNHGPVATPEKRLLEQPSTDAPSKKLKKENDSGEVKSVPTATESVTSVTNASKRYVPPLALRENIIGFLVRLACTIYNPTDAMQKKLVQRVLELIKNFLQPSFWPDVHVKFIHLERTLAMKDMNDIYLPSICNALEILNVDISRKPADWFLVNMGPLYRLLESCIKSDTVRIHTALQPVLACIFKSINQTINPEGKEHQQPDVSAFVSLVESTIVDGIASTSNTYGILKLLQAYCTGRSEKLDQFIPGIVKLLQKLTKEHALSTQPTGSSNPDSQVNLLILSLGLLKMRVSYLGDQRRWFLACLTQLIEKSPDIQLLHAILDMVTEWTLDKTEPFPTIKEKASLLVTMMNLQNRNDNRLTEDYLELVLKIYSNPVFARSELTVRLEEAFLSGAKSKDAQIRSQFMRVLDRSLNRTLHTRLNYILGVQNWESLADSFWIHQALDLLLGAIHANSQLSFSHVLTAMSINAAGSEDEPQTSETSVEIKNTIEEHQQFLQSLQQYTIHNIIVNIRQLQYLDSKVCFQLWVSMFSMAWSGLNDLESQEMGKMIIQLLARDYHEKQSSLRPNVVQALMSGIAHVNPNIKLPPHLIKYLGKTYDAWYTSIEILQRSTDAARLASLPNDSINSQECIWDALADMFSSLSEDDMFYGLWKHCCTYAETNIALSFEQSNMWSQAQTMYENAQIRARNGVLPFTESEYMLWEDHWVLCTERLQQWDVLADLSKHDNNPKLLLDSAWRLSNWTVDRELLEQTVSQVKDSSTPLMKVYEAFLTLIKPQTTDDRLEEFNRVCEEGIQISLKQWYTLPRVVSQSHISLLQIFQQYVEIREASQIFNNLANTSVQSLEQRSNELRIILGSWRDRLPNVWEDINFWSHTVAWRQQIFNAINRAYVPLIPLLPIQGANQSLNSVAYRGYHETAWIINRFAHVARKHDLDNVCTTSLAKIHTLPSVEVQEAFLKLREQVKCYYKNPSQHNAGLDVLNNTNISYFNHEQQAELFVLKGKLLAKLNYYNEANESFVNAVQVIRSNQPINNTQGSQSTQNPQTRASFGRAWAAWGEYNHQRFKENPQALSWANHAVSCYLQAAEVYKNARSRKYLLRVLWLLGLDDQNGSISNAFEAYTGDIPVWYYITFIPQLLMGIQQQESKYARTILMRIAKHYPQALHFQLRTAKEEVLKRMNMANTLSTAKKGTESVNNNDIETKNPATSTKDSDEAETGNTENSEGKHEDKMDMDNDSLEKSTHEQDIKKEDEGSDGSKVKVEEKEMQKTCDNDDKSSNTEGDQPSKSLNQATTKAPTPTHPYDEIMSMLKTGYPLLALSMETMVDQIQLKFKPQPDEEMYRLVVALYNEGVQQLLARLMNPNDNLELTNATMSNIARFASSLYPGNIKTAFVHDFAKSKLNLEEYVAKLRLWRDKFEAMLDSRPHKQKLEASSHYLVEFQHQKFDDVEIPGQYLMLTDNANNFLRIDRFLPEVEIIRNYGNCFRRITIRGHDGSLHPFVIQNPSARQFRREERLMQLFRLLNGVLERKRDSRMRNLDFHLPQIVPLAPNVRMVSDDPSYRTLYEIYEDHCDNTNMHKDEPLTLFVEKLKNSINKANEATNIKMEMLNLRIEINEEIAKTMVPQDILSKYMLRSLASYDDYWFHRKRFIAQYATATFMTYLFNVGHRTPHKIAISRQTGNVWMTEFLPGWDQNNLVLGSGESVPFRFTPNIQSYMTKIGIDGLFSSCLMATASSLTESGLGLDDYLCLFVRDEIISWFLANQQSIPEGQVRELVQTNVGHMIAKARLLACRSDIEKTIQSSQSTLPQKRKDLSSFTRGRIIGHHDSNRNAQEIDVFLGIPQSTIKSVIKKYEEEGVEVPSPRPGCPNKLNKSDATALVLGVKRNPQESFGYHQTTLAQANVEVCLNTVKKHLKEMGYGSYSIAHKPLLTNIHKRNRRHWAMEHKDWTVDQWNNVFWSDESRLIVMGNDSFGKVISKEGERYQEHYIMPTLKFGKGSMMVWGCFWPGGYGPLVTLKDSVDQAAYTKCLEDHFLPWSKNLKEDEKIDFIFQEDGATCHTGKQSKWYKQRHQIKCFDNWPSQTPDLNPIEHLWWALKHHVRKRRHQIHNVEQLEGVLHDE
ncbi:hypothetical protein RMATCC62417_13277 [Rhizopus microsporus]|nr:hypothetical protein RMATCC62417_13277 [Rhizopus microsporus]